MPSQNTAVPHNEFVARSARHDQIVAGLSDVDVKLQKLLAELVMMRLFDELQEALAGIALRLACGTPYVDGTVPNLLVPPAKSTASARYLYENHGRAKAKAPKWSKTSFINDTTKYVLDASDPFRTACSASSLVMSEMQAVRNMIAHRNAGARKNFSIVVKRHYGANLNNISPGLLLLSPRFSPTKLETYLDASRVLAKACARA